MVRKETWDLTIKYWGDEPDARKDGSEHTFTFSHPPTRADFLTVCMMTPWTSAWNDYLQPLIMAHDWPYIKVGNKGSHVRLYSNGKEVGELAVWRDYTYENASYNRPHVSWDAINKSVRHPDKKEWLWRNINAIAESMVRDSLDLKAAIKRILKERKAELETYLASCTKEKV